MSSLRPPLTARRGAFLDPLRSSLRSSSRLPRRLPRSPPRSSLPRSSSRELRDDDAQLDEARLLLRSSLLRSSSRERLEPREELPRLAPRSPSFLLSLSNDSFISASIGANCGMTILVEYRSLPS